MSVQWCDLCVCFHHFFFGRLFCWALHECVHSTFWGLLFIHRFGVFFHREIVIFSSIYWLPLPVHLFLTCFLCFSFSTFPPLSWTLPLTLPIKLLNLSFCFSRCWWFNCIFRGHLHYCSSTSVSNLKYLWVQVHFRFPIFISLSHFSSPLHAIIQGFPC